MKKLIPAFLVLCIIVLGCALRLFTREVPDASVDQAIALYFAKFGYFEMWSQLYRAEIHPWGFYIVLRFFQNLVGFEPGYGPLLPTLLLWQIGSLAFALSVLVLYQIGTLLNCSVGRKLALVFVFAVHVPMINLAIDLRTYPWVCLSLLIAMWCAIKTAATPSLTHFMAWGVAAGMAVQFHFGAAISLLGQFLYLLVSTQQYRRLALASGMALLVALPSILFLTVGDKLAHLQPLLYAEVFNFDLFRRYLTETLLPGIGAVVSPGGVLSIVCLSLVVYLLRQLWVFPLAAWQIGTNLLFLSVTGLLGSPTYIDRYFIFLTTSLLMAAILPVSRAHGPRWLSLGVILIMVGLNAVTLKTLPQRYESFRAALLQKNVFPSRRLQELASLGGPFFRQSLCTGRAALSNDYLAAELLLNFCPIRFQALRELNTQIFPPSNEWKDRRSPPLLVAYLDDTPSRLLYGNADSFFLKSTSLPSANYRRFEWGKLTFWIRPPLSTEPRFG